MGKIANDIFMSDLIREGKTFPTVTSEGNEKGILFYVKKDELNRPYILTEFGANDYVKLLEQLKSNFKDFDQYLPKFGKYEVEQFIKDKFLHALLITGDFTDLFNMEIYFSDLNTVRLSSAYLQEQLLKCFDIPKIVGQKLYIKFKWMPYK